MDSFTQALAAYDEFANDELDRINSDALVPALVETGLKSDEVLPASFPGTLDSILNASFEPVEHPMLPLFNPKKRSPSPKS